MKKFVSMMMTVALVGSLLVGCGKAEPAQPTEDSVPVEVESAVLDEPTAEAETATDDAWKTAYLDLVNKDTGDKNGAGNPGRQFALVNIDGDDVPELVVISGFDHVSTTTVFSYQNGEIVRSDDIGSWGALAYAENTIVGMFTSGAGGTMHFVDVWSLTDGKWEKTLGISQQCSIEEDFNEDYTFYNGEQVITQDEFVQLFNNAVPDGLQKIGGIDFDLQIFEEFYGCKSVQLTDAQETVFESVDELAAALR